MLNPILFTERVAQDFLHYQLTASQVPKLLMLKSRQGIAGKGRPQADHLDLFQ